MARPKADLASAEDLLALAIGGKLAVRVTPGARAESVAIKGRRVLVKVRARPQDGEANAAVCALVAAALGCAASAVRVSRGATSRDKLLAIDAG